MSSKIEQIIDEIIEYVDGCKFQTLSNSKIVVNKAELEDLLRELKSKTPDEIKRYQKIINNKEAILKDAQMKAEQMIRETTAQTNQLISEHEIMQQAYARANEVVTAATAQAQSILDNATIEANNMRQAAMQYTDEILANLEALLTQSINDVSNRYDGIISSLSQYNNIIKSNRNELYPKSEPEQISDIDLETMEYENPNTDMGDTGEINLDLI